jgi:hypothetical protein
MLWWLAACDFFDDPIVAKALDYVAAEPRVLGVRADPPWFVSGEEIVFDALVFGPDGPGGTAALSVCGLHSDVRAQIDDVSCFADESEVAELGTVPGLAWTPPALTFECDDGDTTYFDSECATRVQFLATPEGDGRLSSFGAAIEKDPHALPDSLAAIVDSPPVVALDASEGDDGVLLTATFRVGGLAKFLSVAPDVPLESQLVAFRWTVTGGTLEETGRTLVDEVDGDTLTSVNTWQTAGSGAWAAVVVAATPYTYDATGPLLWWASVEAP